MFWKYHVLSFFSCFCGKKISKNNLIICDNIFHKYYSNIWHILNISENLIAYVSSCKFIATSGVPQGSPLGLILFLLFVSDVLYIFSMMFKFSCSLMNWMLWKYYYINVLILLSTKYIGKIDGASSYKCIATSGVPQGSPLGLITFYGIC